MIDSTTGQALLITNHQGTVPILPNLHWALSSTNALTSQNRMLVPRSSAALERSPEARMSQLVQRLGFLSEHYSQQAVELETLYFLKKQLRLRNQELKEERTQRQVLTEQLKERDRAYETIIFLRQQIRTLKGELGCERSKATARERDLDLALQQLLTSSQLNSSAQEELFRLYQEEIVYGGLVESEFEQSQQEQQHLKEYILNQEEIIAKQNEELVELRQKVSLYQRLFKEIKAAFAPLSALVFRSGDLSQLPPIQLLDSITTQDTPVGSEEQEEEAASSPKQDREISSSSLTRLFREKIVRLSASHENKKHITKKPRWGKISMLLLFFVLTTFGTTDLFSHLRPFELHKSPDLLRPIEYCPPLTDTMVTPHGITSRWLASYHQLHFPVVVLDPGHGGYDPGAKNKDGWRESDFTLEMSLQIEKYLTAMGAHVVMTRRTDRFVSLVQRRELANRFPQSCLVSIHLNAHPIWSNREAHGFSVFYNDDQSLPLAKSIYNSTASILYLKSYNKGIIDGRRFFSPGNSHLGLLKNCLNPGVLVETSFISHDYDFRLLQDVSFRDRMAHTIAQGIIDNQKCP
ncbi:N-acetylmuramoyl-L-alanine amidase [bacterium]|nr:N-acetylmuramoyl-L-alanine amidase [bacterium]